MGGRWAIFGTAVFLLLATPCSSQQADDQADPCCSTDIGYPSVAAAFEALKAIDGLNVAQQEDWILIEDERVSLTLWSFTRPGHPAHPSAVRRLVAERNGDLSIDMRVRCEAANSACRELVRDFDARNEKLRADMVLRIQQRKLRMPP
jgi:hypothetical protein